MKVLALLAFALIMGQSQISEAAPVPADYMTCEQATEHYATYKRIYIIAHGRNVVPIYGMKPISEARNLRCTGRGKRKSYYYVNTIDAEECWIAVYCS